MMSGNEFEFEEKWTFYELPKAANALNIRMSTLLLYLIQNRIKGTYNEGRLKVRTVEVDRYLRQKAANTARCGKRRE